MGVYLFDSYLFNLSVGKYFEKLPRLGALWYFFILQRQVHIQWSLSNSSEEHLFVISWWKQFPCDIETGITWLPKPSPLQKENMRTRLQVLLKYFLHGHLYQHYMENIIAGVTISYLTGIKDSWKKCVKGGLLILINFLLNPKFDSNINKCDTNVENYYIYVN